MTKKILFITRSHNGGGAEKVVESLIEASEQKKFNSYIIKRLILVSNSNLTDDKNIHLNSKSAMLSFLEIYRIIKKENFETIISNLVYVNILLILIITYDYESNNK